jgi:hypothetical protein
VAWLASDASSWMIRAQLFDAHSAKLGAEFLVSTTTTGHQPAVTALADGRFVVAWSTGSDIRAQVFAADGSKSGAEFLVNTTTAGVQSQPTVMALADGRYVIAWVDKSRAIALGEFEDNRWDIRAQVFAAAGSKSGAEFLVNTTTPGRQFEPAITTLTNDHVVVVWVDKSETGGDTSGAAVRGQIIALVHDSTVSRVGQPGRKP